MASGATETNYKFCKYETWSTYSNIQPNPGDFSTAKTEMQSSENIYENVLIRSQEPNRTGSTSSGAKETKRSCRGVAMCLSLLCLLLLAGLTLLAFILTKTNSERLQLQNICKNLTQERDQLQTSYSSLTQEKDQLQQWYNGLAREKDQLQTSYSSLTQKKEQLQQWYDRLFREKHQQQQQVNVLTQERDQLQKKLEAMTDQRNKDPN